ncbi:MAG: ATP synthase subunit I [Thermodesulfobacteriota bacterium]
MSHTTHSAGGGLSSFLRRVLVRSLLFTLSGALLLLALGQGSWARGLVLGGLASALNFLIMAWLLPRTLKPGRGALGGSLVSLVLRLGLMALALALALMYPARVSVFACAAGLFLVQFTLLSDRLLGGRLVGPTSES